MKSTRTRTTRIKTVSYRSCVTVGKFKTVHIEASADVPSGSTPELVLKDVTAFVDKQLRAARERAVTAAIQRRQLQSPEFFHDAPFG